MGQAACNPENIFVFVLDANKRNEGVWEKVLFAKVNELSVDVPSVDTLTEVGTLRHRCLTS